MPTDYRVLPNFAASISRGEKLSVYGTGKQTRTFCYITDAITGFLQVLVEAKSPDVFNVGNPTPEINMLDLVAEISQIKGVTLSLELQDYPESYPADEPNRRCPDVSKLAELVEFKPQVQLKDGLKRFLDWTAANY